MNGPLGIHLRKYLPNLKTIIPFSAVHGLFLKNGNQPRHYFSLTVQTISIQFPNFAFNIWICIPNSFASAQIGLLQTCLWSDIHTDKIPAHWQLHSLFISGHVGISARHSNQFRVSVNTQAKSAVTFFLLFEELLQRKKGIYEHIINLTPRQKLKDFGIDVRGRP